MPEWLYQWNLAYYSWWHDHPITWYACAALAFGSWVGLHILYRRLTGRWHW